MNPRLPDSAASRPFFLDVGMSQASSNGFLPLAFSSSNSFPPSVDQSRQSQLSARQQALYRVLKMKGFPISPLSPQESSVLSDAGSILSQNLESIRFSATDGCVQSPLAFHKKNSVHQRQDHVASSFHRDLQLSELPIVCGPAAFQISGGDNRAWSIGDGSRTNTIGGDPSVGFRAEDKESKRLKRTFEDLERELLGDDADIPSSSVSIYSDAQVVSCGKADTVERDWADYIEDLLAESSNSVPISTVCSTSPASDDLSTDRIYTEACVSQANTKNSFVSGLTNSLTQKQTTSLDASGDSASGPKQLLVACSTAIAESNIDLARSIVVELKQMVNYYGEPQQRVAAYMLDALVSRMDGSNHCLYRALSATDLFFATQILYESCPCMELGYMAANRAIADACKDADRVHIVDFEIGQGGQWISLIGLLAARQGGPPEVRITGVADPELDSTPAGGLQYVGKRLEDEARSKGMLFRFNGLAKKVLDVQPSMLETRAGETLAVNFAFQLHRIPDESVCTTNPRDWLLRLVRSMDPKVVTLVEREANTNTAPFLPRFLETLSYYGALFESLDGWLPRESLHRLNIEQHILARDIVNIVACEGAERVERYEPAGKWRARMTMAGLRPWPLSSLLQKCSSPYRLREEAGALYVGWKDRDLIVASAWH